MRLHCFVLGIIVVLFAGLSAGCRKSESASNRPASPVATPAPPPMETIAQVHWLGLKRIARETNATTFMQIWNLPESMKLRQQTLDKLARAPWRLETGGQRPEVEGQRPEGGDPNASSRLDGRSSTLLRPLLKDVAQEESFLEIQQTPHQPGELAFAIRLSDARAALWQTNLAAVLESLTGARPKPLPDGSGWSLTQPHAPRFIELSRAGGWTLLGAAEASNAFPDRLRTEIQAGRAPFGRLETNEWLAGRVNLRRVAEAGSFARNLPVEWPDVSFTVSAEETNLLTRAELDFPKPLSLDLPPWIIPSRIMDDKLTSFTAIRGIEPFLASLKAWQNLKIGPPPNQLCFWARYGLAMQTYVTAPVSSARRVVHQLSGVVLQRLDSWSATNDLARFQRSPQYNGLEWKGLPYIMPFVRSLTLTNGDFVFGGMYPNLQLTPIAPETLMKVLDRTNLLYHDWEVTGTRCKQWLYMSQVIRYVTLHAELPNTSVSFKWLKAIDPLLGVSVTDVTQTGPSRLDFVRRSGIGLTAVELQLLADWLESPRFPAGLHALLAPPNALAAKLPASH